MRRLCAVAAGVSAGAATTACGGQASTAAPPAAPTATPGTHLQPLAQRCGPPDRPAATFTFRTADGVRLDGAAIGDGTRGVVLVHKAGSEALCGWWPYAVRLAGAGFHVLLFDMRCSGLSACPSGARGTDTGADVRAAVQHLRSMGANAVELVGASYGGSVALVAAVRVPGIAAVADLSGDEITTAVGGAGRPLDASAAAADVRAPLLLAFARRDPDISTVQEHELYARAPSRDKQLVVLPAQAGHGWDMLVAASGSGWSPFSRTLIRFLSDHAKAA